MIEVRPKKRANKHPAEYWVNYPISRGAQLMILYIRKGEALKLGYKAGDKVIILIGKDRPTDWKLKKDKFGFTLMAQRGLLKLQAVWNQLPKPQEIRLLEGK